MTSFLFSAPSFSMLPLLRGKLAAGFVGSLDQKMSMVYSKKIK